MKSSFTLSFHPKNQEKAKRMKRYLPLLVNFPVNTKIRKQSHIFNDKRWHATVIFTSRKWLTSELIYTWQNAALFHPLSRRIWATCWHHRDGSSKSCTHPLLLLSPGWIFPLRTEMRCKLHSRIRGRAVVADGWTPLPMTTASLSSSAIASCSLWRSAADTSHTVSMLVNILSTSTTWQDTSIVTSVGCHWDKLGKSCDDQRLPADSSEAAPPLWCTAPGLWGSLFLSAPAPGWPLTCGSSSAFEFLRGPLPARWAWTCRGASFSLRKKTLRTFHIRENSASAVMVRPVEP